MIEKEKLSKIVGARNVSFNPSVLDEYSRDMSFVNSVRPACVVKPKSAGEVQKIVKLANKTRTPLVPVSSGSPHFRGDTVPGAGGAVIMDLRRMNKVMFVDRPRRVAMVEPGVTFGELIPKVKKEGLRLNMPLLPRRSKSVIGSMLEREPVTMPKYQWDISDPLCCTEVFFGTGDEFRTGQAAGPGTVKEQWKVGGLQKAPYGPGTASWHRLIQGAQGTMGIVTWASMRCELLPSLEEPFVVNASSLSALLELTSWLIRLRIVNECFILNNTSLAAIFTKKWPEGYRNLKDTLPAWTLFYTVAGYEYLPEERVDASIRDISEITQRLGVEAVKAAGEISANEILKAVQEPSSEPYWKLGFKGACQDVFFLTIHDKLECQINAMTDHAEKSGYPASNMGIYIQPVVQGTGYHCEFNLFYDPENAGEKNRVRELSSQAAKNLMAMGAFFSRPYGESAGMILNKDAATVSVLNKLKNIIDPNNIMNPGKICF
ncbi:MAG: FAD-binding oxidoreductase [Acidobacteria bacterium]|nr:FAD-binding oxidoreductase [Acidobacteriota bacterium]